MKNLQKLGGIAALYEAFAYVLGIVFYIFVMDYTGDVSPAQKVSLLVDNQTNMFINTLLVYVVFGVFMVVLALALHERLKVNSPAIMQTATVFGLFWALVVIASGMIFITRFMTQTQRKRRRFGWLLMLCLKVLAAVWSFWAAYGLCWSVGRLCEPVSFPKY